NARPARALPRRRPPVRHDRLQGGGGRSRGDDDRRNGYRRNSASHPCVRKETNDLAPRRARRAVARRGGSADLRRGAGADRGTTLKLKSILLLAVLTGLAAACATAPAPPPMVEPQGDARFLIDPRTGFEQSVNTGFEAAWRYYLAGNDAEAR